MAPYEQRRQAVLPRAERHWSLTTLREKLIKIGAKVVRHARQVVFQMAEVAVSRELFRAILEAIERLRLTTGSPAHQPPLVPSSSSAAPG